MTIETEFPAVTKHERGVEAACAEYWNSRWNIWSARTKASVVAAMDRAISAYIEAGGFDSAHAPIETEFPAVNVRWRVFEDITRGWFGIEEDILDGNTILYPKRINREPLDGIVRAHNAALTLKDDPGSGAEAERFPTELLTLTFAVQHNPNCPSPWLVRLPGKGPIDMLPYGDPLGRVRHQTGDILGFGKSFGEAARAALRKGDK